MGTYQQIARIKGRQARRRYDFAHQATAQLVRGGVGTIAIEALNVASMTASARGTLESPGVNVAQKAGLNRRILDAGWGQIETLLGYKAKRAGAQLVNVRAAYSSQTCHRCGHLAAESRESQARFCCRACGWQGNADVNAARVIAARATRYRRLEESSQDAEPVAIRRASRRQSPTEAQPCAA
jgi:putative transposase